MGLGQPDAGQAKRLAERLSLDQKVAQLFMIGFSGTELNPITRRFLDLGVGGVIFFRDNFQSFQSIQQVKDLLNQVKSAVPEDLPSPLLGIDQEGGQVERLPHTLFPTALNPVAVGLAPDAEALAHEMYGMLGRHLADAGFNLDFFPTLDVNLEHRNPIIGVRALGDDPEIVWRLGEIAMNELQAAGVVPVGKHFPGHGNGTVDSHLDLPRLQFTETELQPFEKAVKAGLPAMLVAHGYYPGLQDAAGEAHLPSSASPCVVRGLLRERLGFEGVIITDDMCMGAITQHRNPVKAALASLEAGVDILLYKQSTADEWAVFEAVREAFASGRLSMTQLEASVSRILALKSALPEPKVASPAEESPESEAKALAQRGIRCLAGAPLPPLNPDTTLLLVHPDRQQLGNYAFDIPTSHELPEVLSGAGFRQVSAFAYHPRTGELAGSLPEEAPEMILWVTFNPALHPAQQRLFAAIREKYPETPVWAIAAGTPYDLEALSGLEASLHLGSYRPASLRALAEALLRGISD